MSVVGKTYDGGTFTVTQADFEAYARATDDTNPAYLGEDAVAPPMFHVRACIEFMMVLATDPELELNLLRLVHGEHDMRFERPLRDGDVIHLTGELVALEDKSSGTLAVFRVCGDVGGETAFEGQTSYFVRKPRPKDAPKKAKAPREPEVRPEPAWTVEQAVSLDQAQRYAEASGDHNPIHLDEAVARAAGLPSVILHGLCTMAFAQRDLIDREAGGDPTRLARLAVRWARPVALGETLTLSVWHDADGLSFETVNAKGQPVVVNGRAEVRAEAVS